MFESVLRESIIGDLDPPARLLPPLVPILGHNPFRPIFEIGLELFVGVDPPNSSESIVDDFFGDLRALSGSSGSGIRT